MKLYTVPQPLLSRTALPAFDDFDPSAPRRGLKKEHLHQPDCMTHDENGENSLLKGEPWDEPGELLKSISLRDLARRNCPTEAVLRPLRNFLIDIT